MKSTRKFACCKLNACVHFLQYAVSGLSPDGALLPYTCLVQLELSYLFWHNCRTLSMIYLSQFTLNVTMLTFLRVSCQRMASDVLGDSYWQYLACHISRSLLLIITPAPRAGRERRHRKANVPEARLFRKATRSAIVRPGRL